MVLRRLYAGFLRALRRLYGICVSHLPFAPASGRRSVEHDLLRPRELRSSGLPAEKKEHPAVGGREQKGSGLSQNRDYSVSHSSSFCTCVRT